VRPRIAYTVRQFHHTCTTGHPQMLTLHIVHARLGYGIDYLTCADEEA
jgi:hypothetical protein